MTRTIYLHIGCGKTGSSALQNWLAQNARTLKEHNIAYPIDSEQRIRKLWNRRRAPQAGYEISSGNGVRLTNALKNSDGTKPLISDLRRSRGDLLYSSETFQSLTPEQLSALNKTAQTNDARIVIIAYVRDVYDIAYSSYLQQVKRHAYTKTFKEFALAMRLPQQFGVLNKFETEFDDIRVHHYDTEKVRGLERSLLESIGVDRDALPPMSKKKVNRSLSVHETELMRNANSVFTARKPEKAQNLSRQLSDTLIYADPERETEILIDDEALESFNSRFGDWVSAINNRYLECNRLRIFSPEGKNVVNSAQAGDSAYNVFIPTLVDLIINNPGSTEPDSSAQKEQSIANLPLKDPRLVNTLRDEAVNCEKVAPQDAFILMSAARVLRPEGAFIRKKVEAYGKRFSIQDAEKTE